MRQKLRLVKRPFRSRSEQCDIGKTNGFVKFFTFDTVSTLTLAIFFITNRHFISIGNFSAPNITLTVVTAKAIGFTETKKAILAFIASSIVLRISFDVAFASTLTIIGVTNTLDKSSKIKLDWAFW